MNIKTTLRIKKVGQHIPTDSPMVDPDLVTEEIITKPKPSFSLLVTVTSYG